MASFLWFAGGIIKSERIAVQAVQVKFLPQDPVPVGIEDRFLRKLVVPEHQIIECQRIVCVMTFQML